MSSFKKYIKKRSITGPWSIYPKPNKKFDSTVVIPSCAESKYIPLTLSSLNKNKITHLKNTLVIVVVNNSIDSSQSIIHDNKVTFQLLETNDYDFTLCVVDASSSTLALDKKNAGVGLARKIGIDLSLPYLKSEDSIIFCTDADTIVDKNYLDTVKKYFKKNNSKAAVVGFKHIKPVIKEQEKAIRLYEEYLLITAKKIQSTGSPYGYVPLGSSMICTVNAYCSIGGMPRKRATEDFYFLQELAKFCKVHTIPKVLVYPSSRLNAKVYLGTAFRMKESEQGFDLNSLFFHDRSFNLLSKWIAIGQASWKLDLFELKNKIKLINPILLDFLIKEGLDDVWYNINENASSSIQFSNQFHRWFDGLKTIRLLKKFS